MKGSPPEFPSLVGISQRYEDDDLSLFIAQGSGRMPGFARLGEENLNAVMRFIAHGEITSVKKQGPSPFDMKYLSDGYNKFLDADGYPAIQPPWGTLNAINLVTGKIAVKYLWRIP